MTEQLLVRAQMVDVTLGDLAPSSGQCPKFRRSRPASEDEARQTSCPWGQPLDSGCGDAIGNRLAVSPAQSIIRRAIEWDGITVELIQSVTDSKVELIFRGPRHLFLVYQESSGHSGDRLRSSLRRKSKSKISFIPAGHELRQLQQVQACCRIICFYLDPAMLAVGCNGKSEEFWPGSVSGDRVVLELASRIGSLLENGSKEYRYCEALSLIVARECQRIAAHPVRTSRGGLACWQERLAASYIEDHLAEKISLDELATLVRLSPGHFCRAFKQSFGIAPHRYLINRRIDHARSLLRNSRRSVTEIGLAVGFGDTSAFSAAFRQGTGSTPSVYRHSVEALTED